MFKLTDWQKHSSDYMQGPIQCIVRHKEYNNKIHFLMSKQLKTNHEMLLAYHKA